MTAKLLLDIDASKAFETIKKLEDASKKITVSIGGGARGVGGGSSRSGGGGKSVYAYNESEHNKFMQRVKKGHEAWVKDLRKQANKEAADKKKILDKEVADNKKALELKLKEEQKTLKKIKKEQDELVKQRRKDAEQETKDKKKALDKQEKDRREAQKKRERDEKEERKRRERDIRDLAKEKEKAERAQSGRLDRAQRWGRGSILSGPLQGGLSRLGGIFPDSSIGLMTRNMVTGSFLGGGIGGLGGGMISSVGRLAGGAISNMPGLGKAAGPLGIAATGLSSMLSVGLQAGMMFKGAAIGGTATVMYEGFTRAVGLFSTVVKTFSSAVMSLVSKGLTIGGGLVAGAGTGLGALTVAGVRSYSERMRGEAGLDVVGGANANRLRGFAQALSSRPGSLYRYSNIVEASTKASAFGMSPGMIEKFLPKMMQAGAVMGEDDIAFGMRALVRAAMQSEPEGAERFGLNLYEKNLKQLFGNKYNLNDPSQKAQAVYAAADIQLQKFQGGESRIRNTPGGAFQYLGNRWTQLKESVGQGFSEGFQLIPRLNAYGDFIGSRGTRGRTQGFFQGVGQMAGKGADWMMRMVPKALTGAKEFMSSKDEGTSASQWGDSFKNFIDKAVAGVRTLIDMIKVAWNLLAGENGIFAQAQAQWDTFWASIKDKSFSDLYDSAVEQLGRLADTIQTTLEGAISAGISKGIEMSINAAPGALWAVLKGGMNAAVGGIGYGSSVSPDKNFDAPGRYANGGVVPGGEGKPQMAVVHGGEMILNRKQQNMVFGSLPQYADGTLSNYDYYTEKMNGAANIFTNIFYRQMRARFLSEKFAPFEKAKKTEHSQLRSPQTSMPSSASAGGAAGVETESGRMIRAAGASAKPYVQGAFGVAKKAWDSAAQSYHRNSGKKLNLSFQDSAIFPEAGIAQVGGWDFGRTNYGAISGTGSIGRYGPSSPYAPPSELNSTPYFDYAAAWEEQKRANWEEYNALSSYAAGKSSQHGRGRTVQRGRTTRRNVTVHGNMYVRGDANDRMRFAEALG